LTTYKVRVDHLNTGSGIVTSDVYDSLADMWSKYYRSYMNDADFPRLIIRFEDTLFHAEKVMRIVSDCVGMPMDDAPFLYELGKAKRGPSSDFRTALAKYGSESGRYDGLLAEDRNYALSALDADVMLTFHYQQAPLITASDEASR